CKNRSGSAITIASFWPQMHRFGMRSGAELVRGDGSVESILNAPFDITEMAQRDLDPRAVLEPGDTIRTICSYFNDSPYGVPHGFSNIFERCAFYTLAYPAHALDNPSALSFFGTQNNCWGD